MRGTEHAVRNVIERMQAIYAANRRWISVFNMIYSSFLTHRRITGIVTPIAFHPSSFIHANHTQSEFHQNSSSHPILISSFYRLEYVILILSQFQIYPLMVNQKEVMKQDSFSLLAVKNDCMHKGE